MSRVRGRRRCVAAVVAVLILMSSLSSQRRLPLQQRLETLTLSISYPSYHRLPLSLHPTLPSHPSQSIHNLGLRATRISAYQKDSHLTNPKQSSPYPTSPKQEISHLISSHFLPSFVFVFHFFITAGIYSNFNFEVRHRDRCCEEVDILRESVKTALVDVEPLHLAT